MEQRLLSNIRLQQLNGEVIVFVDQSKHQVVKHPNAIVFIDVVIGNHDNWLYLALVLGRWVVQKGVANHD